MNTKNNYISIVRARNENDEYVYEIHIRDEYLHLIYQGVLTEHNFGKFVTGIADCEIIRTK